MADQVGYSVEGGLWGAGFDDKYCDAWQSAPGMTDLQNVMPEVKAAFNGIARAACSASGGVLLITGGAEKGCHAPGPYGHEGGWKLDVDPGSVDRTCGRDTFLDLVAKYGAAAGDEGDHYDLAFNSQGGVGGTQVATPQKYLSDGGGSNASASPSSGGGGGGGRGDSQYDGFRFKYMGETVQITKLPDKKTYCEPIYPDLIMVGDSVPKWALDAAAEVTNVTDDSMIQWGKNSGDGDKKDDKQHPEEESPLQKEYDKFAEVFNKYKDDQFKAWSKANNDSQDKGAYSKAATEHPEQFESGIYVGTEQATHKKAQELVAKELDYEKKFKEEKDKKDKESKEEKKEDKKE